MNAKWRVGVGVLAVGALGIVPAIGMAARSTGLPVASKPQPARVLEVYARSPVLVRAGERVRLPVEVVCVTDRGDPCRATVTLQTRAGRAAPWRTTNAQVAPGLEFDLSAPAANAADREAAGEVSFSIRATEPGGAARALPSTGPSAPLRFFVTKELPVVRAPALPFGRTRPGRTALFLPWGSGAVRAGLELGRERATLGPSSFDVDAAGRILVADVLHDRVGEFAGGRLLRQTWVPMGPRADVALADDHGVFVLDQDGAQVVLRRIDARGRLGAATPAGTGIIGQVRTVGTSGSTNLLPDDTWTTFEAAVGGRLRAATTNAGRPVAEGGQLLRVVRGDSVRLATLVGDEIVHPVEIAFAQRVGELALAEPDGAGGYWLVVHVWRDHPPADQYQVLHVSGAEVRASFAVADARFADTPPLGRFRLGKDGALYQLVTSAEGMRILRYHLGRNS